MRAMRLGIRAVGGALVLGIAACGSGADVEVARPPGFEATPEYLALAVADLDTMPHRFEMAMRVGIESDANGSGPGISSTVSGEFDGVRQYTSTTSDWGGLMSAGDTPIEEMLDPAGNALAPPAPPSPARPSRSERGHADLFQASAA